MLLKHKLKQTAMKSTNDLKENWDQIKNRLQKQYTELNDEDLQLEHGDGEDLIGRLQTKLSKNRGDVERMIEDVSY